MAVTRDTLEQQNQPSNENNPDFNATNTWGRKYLKAIFVGAIVGSFSNFSTFFIDKIIINIQNGNSQTLREAAKNSLGKGNMFKGLGIGQAAAITKNIILFPLFQFTRQHIQIEFTANFVAAIIGTYIFAPISVIKTLRYGNQSLSSIQHGSDLFRGVHATAGRDGIQYGMYFFAEPIVEKILKEWGIENATLTGAVSGAAGSTASNPLAVIATRQKLNPMSASSWNVAKSLYRQAGVRGFYPLFFSTSLIRVGFIQGGAIGYAKDYAEKIHPAVEERVNDYMKMRKS